MPGRGRPRVDPPAPMTSATIIISNHDYERFVAEAVDSALAQSVAAQVVAVDDGSTDGSRDILAAYGAAIDVVTKARGGQTSAFNAGLPMARGDLVLFLDADDRLKPTAVERA